jgi:hypothetical protein
MDRDAIIDALLARIDQGADPEDLMEEAVRSADDELHRRALATFKDWPTVLAETAITARALPSPGVPRVSGRALEDDQRPERAVAPGADRPVIVLTPEGQVLTLPLDALPPTREPLLRDFPAGPDASYRPASLLLAPYDTGLALFTTQGNALLIDLRLINAWKPDTFVHPLHKRFPELARHEGIVQMLTAQSLRTLERFYSVSRGGQFKATDCKDFQRLSRSPIPAFLLRDDDRAFRCFAGARRSEILVASSAGKALVFRASEVRSQGRKATGVRAIALDPGAKIVGAFMVPKSKRHLVLATESGLMKRTPLSEYRPQGRAGGGLQSIKLAPKDHVVAATSVDLGADIVALTNQGRFARFPAFDLPFQPRHGRGEPVLPLAADEHIVQLMRAPAGAFAP